MQTVSKWVKGFHASDPARVSEHALAEGGSPHDDVREQRLGRAIDGYDAVPRWIAKDVVEATLWRSGIGREQRSGWAGYELLGSLAEAQLAVGTSDGACVRG